MIEHQVHDDTRHTDVQPKRQSNACDLPMPNEVESKSAIEGDYDEWNDYDSQDRVARQDKEVDGPDGARSLKSRRAVIKVISQVGDQKYDRYGQCSELARTMCGHVSRTNEHITEHQQEGTRSIQTRIDVWKIRNEV